MRTTKALNSAPMTEETFDRLYSLLERMYPGKVWRVVEVCPVAVVKTIDNEDDARRTIYRLEEALRDPAGATPSAEGVTESAPTSSSSS